MYNGILCEAKEGKSLKNNYNFGYVKCNLKRGYIYHVCALAFEIHFPCQNLILFKADLYL